MVKSLNIKFYQENAGRLFDSNVSLVFSLHNMGRFRKIIEQQMWIDHTRTGATMYVYGITLRSPQ